MYANRLLESRSDITTTDTKTPLVVSYDNNPTANTEFYMSTLKSHGWNSVFIGKGEEWRGFIARIRAYAKTLETIDDSQIVVVTDARDVICIRDSEAFMEGFREFKRGIVVSMELMCGGNFEVSDDYKNVQCVPLTRYWKARGLMPPMRKFVNAGLVAGSVKALKQMYAWILENGFTDDQYAIGSYMNTFPDRVAADTDAILLHTTNFGVNAGIQSIHIQKNDSPTLAELYGRGAFFLHIPGMTGTGQSVIYETVRNIVSHGVKGQQLSRVYGYKEPAWNELF